MKKLLLLAILSSFIAGYAGTQKHSRGTTTPGFLGERSLEKDTQPPEITIDAADGAIMNSGGLRGIEIQPNSKGKVILKGTVHDDCLVSSLTINNIKLKISGSDQKKKFSVRVPVPRKGKKIKITFFAKDQAGNATKMLYELKAPGKHNPLPLLVSLSGKKAGQKLIDTGEYWALVIGVGDYSHPSVSDLQFAVSDAQDVSMVLTQNYTFEKNHVNLLKNPTRSQLISALSDYSPSGNNPLVEKDNLMVFYAGHGHWDENYREGYWLPADAQQYNRANWVSNSDVQRAFRGIQARHILLIADACFSGSMFASRSPFFKAVEDAYQLPSRRAITAGVLKEVPDKSVFKEYLIKRLKQNQEPFLDAGSLYNSIKMPVSNNSPISQRPVYGVIQQTGDEGGEFIFMKRK